MSSEKSDVIEFHDVRASRLDNKRTDNDGGNDGGGGMAYLEKEVFIQYEKRIDERLKNIDESIKDNKTVLMWAVGLAVATLAAVVIGFISVIFMII